MKLKIAIYCLFAFFLASCGSKKRILKQKPGVVVEVVEPNLEKLPSVNENEHIRNLENSGKKLNKNTLAYIREYAPIAVHEMHEFNIPASITLAQGILESGNGKSTLASKSKNHFGIKCHLKWEGERVYHDDDEKGECFRKYQHVATSYRDHSTFLSGRKRYAFLFDYNQKNYKKWARGLKKAGYATDKKYPKKLISIIENYKLYVFDKGKKIDAEVKEEEVKDFKPQNTIGNYYEVKKGDTLYSLARRFNTTVDKLKEINGLKNNELSIGQHLLTN